MTIDKSGPQSRREWLRRGAVALCAVMLAPTLRRAHAAGAPVSAQVARTMVVYKTASCGCCKAWVTHVEKAGFRVTARDMNDLSEVKASFGIPAALQSCHTAVVGGYAIEGHVPADLIDKLLREKPVARGLAVPGMPVGSPGMEGGTPERYNVLLFDKAGKSRVFASR